MVEKIIINPEEIRGYGNIISPHTVSDYECYLTTVTESTDTVNGATVTVYSMEYEGNLTQTSLSLTVSSASVSIYDTVTFTATLKDSSNNAVEGATVTFKEGSTSLGTGTTNSSGVATLSTTSLSVGSHSVTANYAGDTTYASSTSSSVSVTVSHSYSLAFSQASYTATGGSATVSCTLTDNSSPVSGATITFTGGTSTVTGTTNSSGVATATVSVSATSTITATYGTVSDTCTVTVQTVTVYYESALTSDDGNWTKSNSSGISCTYDTNGLTVKGTTTGDRTYTLNKSTFSIPDNNFVVECDLIAYTLGAYDNSTEFIVYNAKVLMEQSNINVRPTNNNDTKLYNVTIPALPIHMKFVVTGSSIYVYFDDTLVATATQNSSYKNIQLKTYNNRSMTVKNIEVYEYTS